MKSIANFVAKAAISVAKSAAGSASQFLTYQPKEPAELKQMLKMPNK